MKQDDSDVSHEEEQEHEVMRPFSVTPKSLVKTSLDVKKKQPISVNSNSTTFFSSREINCSIIASEIFRAFCAMFMAVLVVFFYTKSETIAVIRPLFIVVLNDITIVLGRVYLEKMRALEAGEGGRKVVADDGHGHDWHGVKILERGLVAYQSIRGIFIDCSIYAVIVVCCLSMRK